MKGHLRATALALSLAAFSAGADPAPQPDASKAIISAAGAILRGNSADALTELRRLPAADFSGEDAQVRTCMIERFDRATPPSPAIDVDDPFVRSLLKTYQDYWWQALRQPARRAALETDLQASLRKLLGDAGGAPKDMDALELVVQSELERRGYHAQLGTTSPLRDLILWRQQTARQFEVAMVDGPYSVRAELLDDFASIGWAHFGTCGKAANGGWATEDALYAVLPRYKEGIDDESFQIVFLGHEAQHLADKNRFPAMADWELEYRAKLAELARASGALSQKRLLGMIAAQGDSPDAAHPYANTHVVRDLTARLGQAPDKVPVAALQQAATELLREDSQRRSAGRLTKQAH